MISTEQDKSHFEDYGRTKTTSPYFLVFNGSETLEGDTKIALATTEALAGIGKVRVISIRGEAADAFDSLQDVKVTKLPNLPFMEYGRLGKGIKYGELLAYGLHSSLFHRPDLIYTYDRTAATHAAVSLSKKSPLLLHINNSNMFETNASRFERAANRPNTTFLSIDRFVNGEAKKYIQNGKHEIVLNCLPETPPEISKEQARENLEIDQDQKSSCSRRKTKSF